MTASAEVCVGEVIGTAAEMAAWRAEQDCAGPVPPAIGAQVSTGSTAPGDSQSTWTAVGPAVGA